MQGVRRNRRDPCRKVSNLNTGGERTIVRLWRDAVSAGRTGAAYVEETGPGRWREVSWDEAARAVEELANGLLSRGIGKGDVFGIVSRTRLEWTLFDFALASVGAITAPVYPNTSAREAAYVLEHAEAVGALVEDETQVAKVEPLRLAHVLTPEGLNELRAEGIAFAREHPAALDAASAAIGEEDLYTYIYTSGTTGPPKGCMIRHRNYYAMTACIERIEGLSLEEDVMLLYLPLAHNFGRLMSLWGAYAGFTIAFCPDPYAVAEALPEVRPTLLPSVPRLYEKAHAAIASKFEAASGPRRGLADWAVRVGREASGLKQEGKPLPRSLALRYRLADRLVYSKVKERFGGRLRFGISGGAPLAKEIAELFHALDVLILEGWGLTECTTAATVNRPRRFRFGTVGPAMPGVEVKTDDEGELLIRSATVFAGYLKDEEATRAVLTEDGWLRSGDVGAIDADGFVTITDRKKDIIVTAGGKNLAPQNIENALKMSPYVSQALVIGDRRPYVTALITLDEDDLEAGNGVGGAQALVQNVVDDVNRELSRHEQIKRFAIVPRQFSAEEGEVTPTLKLKRRVIEERFSKEIEELYG
ncbi:MAG TPA: long-chain fatty acid--CoA ligase [Gaiellaceae bacterium]|nr:long-chain fatty acid--CoA ligase [Gaiellaceae bacterium]